MPSSHAEYGRRAARTLVGGYSAVTAQLPFT
jgi:hypothetical protein